MSEIVDGAFLVTKPAGITSFDVIRKFQFATKGRKTKFGHTGTLDPFATGLLIVLVGRAVKLSSYFTQMDKTYRGTIRFGSKTSSGDPTTTIIETSSTIPSNLDALKLAAKSFTQADYWQIPPMYSSVKKNGRPLYQLARKGIEIEREPRLRKIHDFTISSLSETGAKFKASCSSGTYIRTLAQDLAEKLGSIALLEQLERTEIGPYSVESAVSIEDATELLLSDDISSDEKCFVPFIDLFSHWPKLQISDEQYLKMAHGNKKTFEDVQNLAETQFDYKKVPLLSLVRAQKPIGLAQYQPELGWKIVKIFDNLD